MAYTPTLADTQEILAKAGYKPSTYAPQSAGGLKSFALGASQGALDTIISAINAADIGGNKINQLLGGHAPVVPMIQHPDIAAHLGIDTSSHPYIKGAGELAGGSVLPGGAYVKGLKLLPEAKGLLKVIPRAISGGSAGALTGENAPGGRVGSALGGSVLGAGGTAAKTLLTPTNKLATGIAARAIQKMEEGANKYKKALVTAKQTPIASPKVDDEFINSVNDRDLRLSIGKMLANPTIQTAHEAQSDLGRYVRESLKNPSKSSIDRQNIRDAKRLRGNVRAAIAQGFKDSGQENLGNAYSDATKFYRENTVNYLANNPLQEFIKGNIDPNYLMRHLTGKSLKASKFNKKLGQDNPEIADYKAKKSLANIALLGGIGIPGFHYIKEVL